MCRCSASKIKIKKQVRHGGKFCWDEAGRAVLFGRSGILCSAVQCIALQSMWCADVALGAFFMC